MNKELEHIFGSMPSEKHYVPNTISVIDRGRNTLNVTAGQNANWTYANFFILDSESPITDFSINEGQYVVAFRDGEWGIWDYSNSLVAKGLKAIESFVKKVSDAETLRISYLSGKHINFTQLTPIILYGPPGTGKTHSLQADYIDHFEEDNHWFTTFHQSFSYEEFVEGLKPILDEKRKDVAYKIEKGVFYEACKKAAKLAGYDTFKDCITDSKENRTNQFNEAIKNNKLVLLCIDEINRGNVASIFGDLISLIEPSKRLGAEHELILTLPYSKKKFGVPANLLIVGTMNTADRSIQLLDSALRRRFEFKELLPDYSIIKNTKAREILKAINSRVRALINKDSQIGHSYFYDIPENTDEEATLIMKALVNKIIPLLEEYFYNDHTKIRFVLSEDDSTENKFYVKDTAATNVYSEYAKIADFDEKMDLYELNPDLEKALEDEQRAKAFLDRWN